MKFRYLALFITLIFLGFSVTAVAHPCSREPGHRHCDPGGTNDSGKVYLATLYFDDTSGDSIKSDGNGPYVNGADAELRMPVEFSPPGQFVFNLKSRGNRFIFFDFGAAVNCSGASSGLGCVVDKTDDDRFKVPVPCPFSPGSRLPNDDTLCAGFRQAVISFRHAFVPDENNPLLIYERFMLGMPNNVTFDGESGNIEIDLEKESKRAADLRLRFDDNCLGQNKGEFLKITAWKNVTGIGTPPNDKWRIDTGTGTATKTACLTKKGKGNQENLVGLFDMNFGYTICILTGASEGNAACLPPTP